MMELYNFFTEVVDDAEKIEELKYCYKELKPICENVQLILWRGLSGKERYSIIGQIYGIDTNAGDTDLLHIFINIKYTWFNAFNKNINNLQKS